MSTTETIPSNLAQSENRFRLMVESSREIFFFERDADHRVLYISPSCKNITGHDPEDVMGHNVAEFMCTPESVQQVTACFPLQQGAEYRRPPYIVQGRHKNGTEISFEISECWRVDQNGALRVQGFAHDITNRRIAERQLELSDQILRRISAIVVVANGEGQIVYVSPSATRVLGFSAAELLGYGWWKHEGGGTGIRKQACESVAAAARGDRPFRQDIWEEIIYDNSGNPHCLLWQEAKGPGDLLIGIAQEITDKKKIDEELNRRSIQLRAIFDNAIEGMFIVNDQFQYVDANPAGCEIFGRKREEIIGQAVGTFSPPNTLSPDLWRTIRQKGEFVGEHQIQRPDGSRVDVEVSIKLAILPGLHLAMLRDVTEKKRLQSQFLQSQKMEALGRLAGGVAHDVNNMLMAIRGYGELLQQKLRNEDGTARYTDNILQAVDRAALITRQLLAFSRQQVIQPQRLNLNTVVIDMSKLLQGSIGEDIRLQLSLDSELGECKADPGEIGQVLLNLAINAKDAMPNGGSLHISTSNVTLDASYLRAHLHAKPGEYVLLNFTDTGYGMDSETIAKIFEPFFTTKAPGKGTGLGLPTAYGIVKQAGGFIYVYSEPGQGTSFKVYFPRTDVPLRPTVIETQRSAENRTVLVLDDDASTNNAVADFLRTRGYVVLQARSGRQATELCQEQERSIDAVISDITMPGTDGADLHGFLAIHQPEAKIIYISGFSRESLHDRGVLPLDAPFLQKPFRFEDLVKKLERALSKSQAEDSELMEL